MLSVHPNAKCAGLISKSNCAEIANPLRDLLCAFRLNDSDL